jgi:hypothetical protein
MWIFPATPASLILTIITLSAQQFAALGRRERLAEAGSNDCGACNMMNAV